ncbi:uncharacterized protein LOC135427067 [Drosophila montana]|uniref:uncharacterized protein LOC135427067 n=1 Tax=Drosophila montana TaxID=40370 RepID=UPI00313A90A5
MTPKFLIYLTLVAMLVVFSAPAAEGTFLLLACLARSPLCPFRTTTPVCPGTGSTYSPITRECA